GLVEEAKLDSFNLPWYVPSIDEVRAVIQEQKSFHTDLLDTIDDSQNKGFVLDTIKSEQTMSRLVRAVTESMIVSHFGEEIVEDLFLKYAEYADKYMKEKSNYVNLVMTVTKKN
ncbi:hypothetical protein AQUCO_03300137v1, partial [Aquilegia coerulea]